MTIRQYILLPRTGFKANSLRKIQQGRGTRISAASKDVLPNVVGASEIEVRSKIGPDDGPRVLEMSIDTARGMRREGGPFVLAPVRRYRPAVRPFVSARSRGLFDAAPQTTQVKVQITDEDENPIRGAVAVVILDWKTRVGFRRTTGVSGRMTWKFPGAVARADRIFIYPPAGYWGRFEKNVGLSEENVFELPRIQPKATDHPPSPLLDCMSRNSKNRGKGVVVGIIDTGVAAKHPSFRVSGGANLTDDGNDEEDYDDVGEHGTHVAGIIGCNGVGGVEGVAPKATLRAYRVFEAGKRSSDTIAIMRAIYRGVEDGCDILNLSLGGGAADLALSSAIGEAAQSGTLCVIASGNGSHQPVAYPAWYKRSVAVSAYGREGTFPDDSVEVGDIAEPFGPDGLFFAAFSNAGFEVDLIGPGVGVVSAAPGGGFAAMSGTSMACPAVSGVAACILSDNKDLQRMPRSISRALELARLLRSSAVDCTLPGQFQGGGRCQAPAF